MRHNEVRPIRRQDAMSALESGDADTICDALIRVTYHDSDWRWIQDICIKLADHPNSSIRGLAATCIGHIARIHGVLDMDRVLPVLNALLKDPVVAGRAEDAFDDIRTFMGKN